MFVELFILMICLICYLHYNKRKNLPPGPFSIPFFGSIFSLKNGLSAGSIMDRRFHKYGDMYTLLLGPFINYVVINNLQLAKDLFSRDEFSGIV